MKKMWITFTALLLVLLLTLGGCASHGKTLIKLGKEEISVNVFQLYLSRMKGTLAAAGEDVNSDEYWAAYTSIDGQTVSDYYTEQVFNGLKQIAAALYLYEELGLKLSKEEEDAIDEWIEALIEEVGEGSEALLNSVLASYGANITVLRDAAIIEAKVEQLKTHLYGEDGALLLSTAKEEFYQKTYYRGYQMLFANYYHDHEKDDDKNAVYYNEDGKIAYDKVNGQIYTDDEGQPVTDKNEDVVYRYKNEDDTWGAIAYDKENGVLKYYYDEETGEPLYEKYTEEEMQSRYKALQEIAEACKGDEQAFLDLAAEYSDNSEFNTAYAPNGMYFSAGTYTSDTVFYTFSTELAKLEIGELVILDSDSGYYLLMRVGLDKEAWSNEDNKRWFTTLNTLTVEYMLQQRTLQYLDLIEVDEKLLASVDITGVAANNYY